ncbi:glycosyltransferase [Burkholderia multivorans]|uniref:glycosyltransferase n=1 Tax=Burkholderia multivorans TaxID=87883 RepID=UPI0012DC9906|nr:glycosyltransferase [Burkholderia multivorans]MBU9340298.1 glycosyltransferase [Burkholderia multivorans]MCA8141186.1 glycosyltransferase [Burkholderia multivorans]QGR60037.1 glycosyltransferase [Burkholderia multivorans]WVN03378.1 glycosyltransferase [Burkholderia multivorans]
MKVLFATYPMAFHTPGGGEIQLLAYRKHLPAHGVDVALFDPWNPGFLEHDVVHFFSCVGGSVHFCNFVKQLGLPLVVSSSLWVTEETKHLYPIGEIHHQFSLADRVVANSDIECETLARVLDLPRDKFVSVLNGVESMFYERQPASLFRDAFNLRERFVLNVGNIEPRKNQLGLVRAMKSFPDLKLVLIGHQRDLAYARTCLEEGGEQVIYLGALPHESPMLRSAYAACDAFCLPSTLETPGLAALEAHAAGARIAVTREGSTEEYFQHRVAYLDPNDVASIAQSIHDAMTFDHAAAHTQRDLSWQAVLSPLKTLYTSLRTT